MNRRLGPLTRWRESLYWIQRLRQFLYGDYDHLKSFAAVLEERSDIEQHLALPIAFATLERVSRSDSDDIYTIDGAITSVLSDLDAGRLTLKDGSTPVSAPPDAASRVQVITLRQYDFRWFQRFEIDLLQARTLRDGENQLTRGHGLSARPAARLHDYYPMVRESWIATIWRS